MCGENFGPRASELEVSEPPGRGVINYPWLIENRPSPAAPSSGLRAGRERLLQLKHGTGRRHY